MLFHKRKKRRRTRGRGKASGMRNVRTRVNASGKKFREISEMVGSEILEEVEGMSASRRLAEAREILENRKVRGTFLWIFSIIATLAFSALTAIALFQSVTMQESSMEPTLSIGEKFFMNRIIYRVSEPKRGDIVVFKGSGAVGASLHIRRIIGLPGETIQIVDGQILINGETYREGKDFPAISSPGMAANPITLDSEEYFVLGDNRNNSEDSRHGDIGKVKKQYIMGKLWFISSPLRKAGFLKK